MQSIYIHTPFCAKVCHYCDFSVLSAPERLYEEYLSLLKIEMEIMLKRYPEFAHHTETIYWGGGTPSILNTQQQNKVFDILKKQGIYFSSLLEFSMEVNPESCFEDRIENAIQHGVNRFSLGIQTFHDDLLKRIGRSHDVETAIKALQTLLKYNSYGISISGDLMFNLPGQTIETFLSDVRFISEQNVDHISFYGLNIAPMTVLGKRIERGSDFVDESVYEPMYLGGVELLSKAGFDRYEVSNFAKPEKQSLHNKNYWNGGSYLGFGPGAHSFVGSTRFHAPEKFAPWRQWVLEGCPESSLSLDPIGKEERLIEKIWLSLRTSQGLNLKTLELESIPIPQVAIQHWENQKMLVRVGDHVHLHGRGWVYMDSIIQDFLR